MSARTKLRSATSAALLAGIVIFGAGQAPAMPTLDHGLASSPPAQVEQVRWVCGPWRCFWRPNYWGFYRPWHPWASIGPSGDRGVSVGLGGHGATGSIDPGDEVGVGAAIGDL
jgi:hypothetical protein